MLTSNLTLLLVAQSGEESTTTAGAVSFLGFDGSRSIQ